MSFDFSAINTITNEDFAKSNGENLKKVCIETANYHSAGDLEKFCEKARDVIEIVLRYIYKRVTNKNYSPRMVGGIINDSDFVIKLNNAEIIRLADIINHISSKYNHAPEEKNYNDVQAAEIDRYKKNQVIPQDAKEILDTLPQFLRVTIKYINTLKPDINHKVNLFVTNKIDKNSGKSNKVLKAEVYDSNPNERYEFKWNIKGGEKIYYSGSALFLKKSYIGKTIVVKAVNSKNGNAFKGEYIVKTSDFQLSVSGDQTKNLGNKKDSIPVDSKVEEARNKQVAPKRDSLLTADFDDNNQKITERGNESIPSTDSSKHLTQDSSNKGNDLKIKKDSSSAVKKMSETSKKQDTSKKGPLLTASFLEAELAKELLKTQEDYDAEE